MKLTKTENWAIISYFDEGFFHNNNLFNYLYTQYPICVSHISKDLTYNPLRGYGIGFCFIKCVRLAPRVKSATPRVKASAVLEQMGLWTWW